ncbi:MAG: FAD-dependent oxidoreductase, partial [Candidatus Amulumruptor sp.]|nr:FAD-dependent oxidoreductase [Candidatus Amulumruptor sp.]
VPVAFTVKGREKRVEAAVALMAVGRKAVVPQGAVEAGVTLDRRGFIVTDDRFMTSAEGVYAIGDVNGKCLLAHAAEAQGHRVLGLPVNLDVIPAVCFTSPAVATVGLTAAQAREKGYEPRESSATFRSNGYALAIGEPDGMVKMVTDVTTGRMLGCHICGPHAADLIAEPALAIAHGLTAADIASTVHAHPTLCETVARAAAH